MNRYHWFPLLGLIALLTTVSSASAQTTPYIGFVYPAGGQQGTTVQIRLGGQRLDGVDGAIVSGDGVSAELIEYYRKLSNQEMTLLREQLKELKQEEAKRAKQAEKDKKAKPPKPLDKETQELIERLEKRIADWVPQPACAALSSLAVVKVTIAPDAKPGARELRLVTQRGTSNPMVFHVGQFPEVARKPMQTCKIQTLGKEAASLRKRPDEEIEETITVPCTMNGQIASGEVNQYRFEATKGQQLVISTDAREL
ncbi:MAG TPA: hypothetical protein VE890_12070, partial [Thermoguttaceae bacterium]|nr:hypothetical protein [Thermoguttaceae bacterium]